MEINSLIELLDARIVTSHTGNPSIEKGFCSDLMSDVLTLDTDKTLLITGTSNLQTIRTSEMADIRYILLVRNKKATEEMIKLAEESDIMIMESPYSSFRTCGLLYQAGVKPVF
jgi:hypothetical protein